MVKQAGLSSLETGDDLRIRDRGNLRFVVNYGPKSVNASHLIDDTFEIVVGSTHLPTAGVLIARKR